MRYPPRLAHLATAKVAAAKLAPAFAKAHFIEEDEARDRLERALPGAILEDLLEATWETMQADSARFNEEKALEKIASTLKDRPMRPGRIKGDVSQNLSAFYLSVDIVAGTASDAARRVLETDIGRKKAEAGLEEAGRYLAGELLRGP